MRRTAFLLLASAALGLVAVSSASSADLGRRPVYKAPPPPPPPAPLLNWSGFYVGLNAGGTWSTGNSCNDLTPDFWDVGFPHGGNVATTNAHLGAISAAGTGCLSNNSHNAAFIGGGQIGYNWQFTNWLVGVETDIQGLSHHNNNGDSFTNVVAVGPIDPSNYFGNVSIDKRVDWLGTLRGRLGFLVTPAALIYATGGLAYGGVKADTSVSVANDVYIGSHAIAGSAFSSASETKAGWTLGGGLEWMFAPQWSLKAEYLYYDLGHLDTDYTMLVRDHSSTLTATFAGHSSADFKGHIARAGINYHF